jgi:hypothetical protein
VYRYRYRVSPGSLSPGVFYFLPAPCTLPCFCFVFVDVVM